MASEHDTYTFNRQANAPATTIRPRPANVRLHQVPIGNGGPIEAPRNAAQRQAIERLAQPAVPAPLYDDESGAALAQLFGPALGWAYRCYHIAADHNHDLAGQPLLQNHIYLFNVLVACEWQPSAATVALIERAMRRAADFLFDVTDGWMTIGQALVGGPAFLNCADIQLMASNRLLPRSWVGGLHEESKYMPIRVGRGLWQKNSRGSIPWDEPEGYRVLVHEWAHYALELLDDYVDTHEVYTRGDANTIGGPNELRRSTRRLVVPSVSQPVESIMATLEGTSELTAKKDADPQRRKRAEWDALIEGFAGRSGRQTKRFPRITVQPAPIEAPFPLRELPHVAWLSLDSSTPTGNEEFILPRSQLSPLLQAEHCWLYVLKGRAESGVPQRVIAQGTLDARLGDGFPLLGAALGDTLMLVGNGVDWRERVLVGEIGPPDDAAPRADGRRPVAVRRWADATPDPFPVIDVLPEPVDTLEDRTARLRVQVSKHGQNGLEPCPAEQLYVFPLDQVNSAAGASAVSVDITQSGVTPHAVSLDGHVFVKLPGANGFVIATYAQGGGPPTGSPTGGTPLTPGSSDGNLLVFFADQGEYPDNNQHHGALRVVTTRWPGGAAGALGNGAEPRSYAYTLCSNGPLPLEYLPTLSLFYDKRAEIGDGEAIIHRQDDSGAWQPVASYRPSGAWYVAAPLDRTTAPRLIDPTPPGGQRVERYRLYVVPRSNRVY